MKTFWLATASGVLLCSAAAMAQAPSNSETTANTPSSSSEQQAQPGHHLTGASLRAQVRSNLEQAGFTDVKVVPDSFLVQAIDKSGNPVSMIINPNSVTEVVDTPVAKSGSNSKKTTPKQK